MVYNIKNMTTAMMASYLEHDRQLLDEFRAGSVVTELDRDGDARLRYVTLICDCGVNLDDHVAYVSEHLTGSWQTKRDLDEFHGRDAVARDQSARAWAIAVGTAHLKARAADMMIWLEIGIDQLETALAMSEVRS